MEHILVIGNPIRLEHSIEVFKITALGQQIASYHNGSDLQIKIIMKRKLVSLSNGFLYTSIQPHGLHGVSDSDVTKSLLSFDIGIGVLDQFRMDL